MSDDKGATEDSAPEISAVTRPGVVALTVSDLPRSLEFYTRAIGLSIIASERNSATLGVGDSHLLHLIEEKGAQPTVRHTGLYHFALLLPQRVDLARWLAHAAQDQINLTGLSDHFVSEAIYLNDPDGHGIEIYWDRPRELWEGLVDTRMNVEPLDTGDLLGELTASITSKYEGVPDGSVMGHVHLKVSSIEDAIAFYRDVLGFALMARLGHAAAFFGAGGYHHHIGTNTWESKGAAPPPPGSAALRYATLTLPDREEQERVLARVVDHGFAPKDHPHGALVMDPAGNGLLLAAPHSR